MAAVTSLYNAFPGQQSFLREFRHRIMAIAARKLARLVNRPRPVDALAALMALQALPVHDVDRADWLLQH